MVAMSRRTAAQTLSTVSTILSRQARAHDSAALEGDAAHLRTDALTSAGGLAGLALVEITGVVAFDSITALVVASAIVVAGIRIIRRSSGVLVDEVLPAEEMDRIVRGALLAHSVKFAASSAAESVRSMPHRSNAATRTAVSDAPLSTRSMRPRLWAISR